MFAVALANQFNGGRSVAKAYVNFQNLQDFVNASAGFSNADLVAW